MSAAPLSAVPVSSGTHTPLHLEPISPQLFEALIRHSQDVIALVSAEGRTLYVSPSYTRVLGYTPDEQLTEPSVFAFVHPDDRPRAEAAFVALLGRPGISTSETVRARHKDGTWRSLEVIGTNLLHEPEVRAIVANFRDITDRMQQAAAQSAQQSVQAKLEGALLMARTAAHELLNALQPARGFADLLLVEPTVRRHPRLALFAKYIVASTVETAHRIQRLQEIVRVVEDTSVPVPEYPLLDVERSSSNAAPPATEPSGMCADRS